MKNKLLTLILILSVFIVQTAQAQATNPDTLVHRIFTTLKNKDEKAFIALYPNKLQMSKLLNSLIAALTIEIAKLDTTKKDLNTKDFNAYLLEEMKTKTSQEELAKLDEKFAREFKNIIQNGEQKGIDWSKAVLVRYTYDTTATDKNVRELFGNNGFKTMKGIIYFTSNGMSYKVNFTQALYLPEERGWYGAGLENVFSEGEKFPLEWGTVNDTSVDNERQRNQQIKATIKSKSKSSDVVPSNQFGIKTKIKSGSKITSTKKKPTP